MWTTASSHMPAYEDDRWRSTRSTHNSGRNPPYPSKSATSGSGSGRANISSTNSSSRRGSASGNSNSRSSHYQGSVSSSSSSAGYSSLSIDKPSPSSSSATSTSSSLRTPPDLLLNGATLAAPLSAPAGKSSYNPIPASLITKATLGKQREVRKTPANLQHLPIAQLESRLKILARATQTRIMNDSLPSPPASPSSRKETLPEAVPDVRTTSSNNKKRRASDNEDDIHASSHPMPDPQRLRFSAKTANAPDGNARSSNVILPLPRVRDWSKEKYFETAIAYRHRGRELKHRGDRRLRDSSAQLGSPKNEAFVASLEQTDALLLYTYGFWCEDQGSSTCVAANWHSIYALLRYVYLRYEKGKMNALSGLCRLLEASILRHVSAHEMRMLHHRMGKASSAEQPSRAEMMELSSQMTKVVGDQERSARLYVQARQSVFNLSNLQQHYPRLANFCMSSMQSGAWMTNDPLELATRLDPSDPACTVSHASAAATSTCGWSWPLDVSSPFPMIVCFGRALLREAALEAQVDFTTESVVASPRPAA